MVNRIKAKKVTRIEKVKPVKKVLSEKEKVWKQIEINRHNNKFYKEIKNEYKDFDFSNYDVDDFDRFVDEGSALLRDEHYEKAQKMFEKAIMIDDFHHSSYEFLSYALYLQNKQREKAIWLMSHAIEIAQQFLSKKILDEMQENLNRIMQNKELKKWW